MLNGGKKRCAKMINSEIKNREWKTVKLGEVCRIKGGFAFKSHDFTSTGTPVVKIGEIQNSRVVYSKNTSYLSQDLLNKPALQSYLLKNGDVLIAMTGATTGKIGKFNNGIAFLNQRVGKFEPCERLDNNFIYYLSQTQKFFKAVTGNILASAQGNVSPSKIEGVEINLPPLPEQKAIARILNTAQDAIAGQEELIEKLKKLKKSMMQYLFTHGSKNEPTKTTEIGEIPESWEVVKLGKVVNFRTGKLNANAMEDNGIYPFFTCSQDNFKINTFAFDCEALLLSGNNARAVYSVKHYQGKFNAYQRTYVITLKNSNDNYIFMKYILEMNLENLKSLSIGSSTKYLTLGMLQNLQISRPRQTEQSKIGNAMESIDQKIESAQTKLSAYQKLFKTLLHELMSGERRIG